MGEVTGKELSQEEGASATPKGHQKAWSIAEIPDEEIDDLSDQEFRKNNFKTFLRQ